MKYSLYALLGFTVVCLFVFMFVASFLLYFTSPNSSSQHLQYFGQVGDFFGGMLNPVLAFASFIALLYTIRIQSNELEVTRKEFEKSAIAQSNSATALQEQLEESRKQYLMGQYHELFSGIGARLNGCLSAQDSAHLRQPFRSYKKLLLYVFESYLINPEKLSAAQLYDEGKNESTLLIQRDILQLLARLATLLQEYATKFGSTAVYKDYIYQFTEVVAILHFSEVLDARFGDFQVFNIDEFYESAGFCALDSDQRIAERQS